MASLQTSDNQMVLLRPATPPELVLPEVLQPNLRYEQNGLTLEAFPYVESGKGTLDHVRHIIASLRRKGYDIRPEAEDASIRDIVLTNNGTPLLGGIGDVQRLPFGKRLLQKMTSVRLRDGSVADPGRYDFMRAQTENLRALGMEWGKLHVDPPPEKAPEKKPDVIVFPGPSQKQDKSGSSPLWPSAAAPGAGNSGESNGDVGSPVMDMPYPGGSRIPEHLRAKREAAEREMEKQREEIEREARRSRSRTDEAIRRAMEEHERMNRERRPDRGPHRGR
jgi:hypothetical protein